MRPVFERLAKMDQRAVEQVLLKMGLEIGRLIDQRAIVGQKWREYLVEVS